MRKNNNMEEIVSKEEIDFRPLFNIFKRNLKFIIITTFSVTITSVIYSLLKTPIYRGGFEIVVEENNDNPMNNLSEGAMIRNAFSNFSFDNTQLKTQEFILKSPSVLLPVYNYVMKNDISNSSQKLDYKTWFNDNLEIKFAKDTNILSIYYKNKNKLYILDVLELISKRYQEYSKMNREKKIMRSIEFLSDQKVNYKIKANLSRKELNKFAIDNGLGDLDGFLNNSLGATSLNGGNLINSQDFQLDQLRDLILNQTNQSGSNLRLNQRYQQQFTLLENYEAQYTNLSSVLKPESNTLKNLNIKIKNLKESLKRPTEILLKYRELKSIAERDESIFNNIEDELALIKLEKIKKTDPWQLISEPTIDRLRVSPKRGRIVLSAFSLSILFGWVLSYLKEKLSSKIYCLFELKKILNSNFIDTIYSNNINLSNKILKNIIIKNKIKNNIGLILLDQRELATNNNFLKDLDIKFNLINLDNENSVDQTEKLLILLEEKNILKKDVQLLNQYQRIYEDKIIGWVLIK